MSGVLESCPVLRRPCPAYPEHVSRSALALARGQPVATLGGGGGAQLAEPVAAAAGALGEEVGELPRHAPPSVRSSDLRQAGRFRWTGQHSLPDRTRHSRDRTLGEISVWRSIRRLFDESCA